MSTEKMRLTQQRNWKIRQLRGLYALSHLLTDPWAQAQLKTAVDAELTLLGAETEALHRTRLMDSLGHD